MTKRTCSRCGANTKWDDTFCANCGAAQAPSAEEEHHAPVDRSLAVMALVFLVVAVLGAVGAWLFLGGGDDTPVATAPVPTVTGDGAATTDPPAPSGDAQAPPTAVAPDQPISLGGATGTVPDPVSVVESEEYGLLPTDRIYVVGAENATRAEIDVVAVSLGGSVTGEIPFIEMFEISIPPAGEAGVTAALDGAIASPAVELAFPDQAMSLDEDFVGVRTSPLNDPVYGGDEGGGYEAIGLERAWSYVRGSGLALNPVSVGIADTALWRGAGEFDDVKVTFPDPDAGETADPLPWTYDHTDKNGVRWTSDTTYIAPDGGHGTGVANIIAADGGDGGVTGVASVLGDKLELAHVDVMSDKYGSVVAVPPASFDPNDPTQYQGPDGAWSVGALRGLVKLVESPAKPKIINMSFGCTNCDPQLAAAYKRFFKRMADEHPDVLFVASAGNDGQSIDGSRRFPSGLALPNMITVGNIDNDGQTNSSSNRLNATPGQEYEVTVAAPGHQAVRGVRYDGAVVDEDTVLGTVNSSDGRVWKPTGSGGTSMAAPQVAATAAILRSIDPTLTAAQIKDIIRRTAQTSVPTSQNLVAPGMGAGALATDRAVLEVINKVRAGQEPPLGALTAEDLEARGVIDAVASTTDGKDFTVTATITGCADPCTAVSIRVDAEHALSGSTTEQLAGPGQVTWGVTLVDPGAFTIFVQRTDNGAGSLISVGLPEIAGTWNGTFTLTEVITDEEVELPDGTTAPPGTYTPEDLEQCSEDFEGALGEIEDSISELLDGLPITVEFTGTLEHPGSVTISAAAGGGEAQTGAWRVEGSSIVFETANAEGYIAFSGTVTGGTTMTGSWGGISQESIELRGVFALTKAG